MLASLLVLACMLARVCALAWVGVGVRLRAFVSACVRAGRRGGMGRCVRG